MSEAIADLIALNRAAWDVRADQHVRARFYDVAGWLAGADSLRAPELDLLGDVADARLLHLQCHFGLDTLSLARRGARVTGVDFSKRAIAHARQLTEAAGLTGEFVECDVLQARAHPALGQLAGRCDIVFASYGTVGWLPDLDAWAATVAHFLRPGGRCVFVEFHPVHEFLGEAGPETSYSYFGGAPTVEEEGTYTDVDEDRPMPTAYWDHPLSAVVQALIDAGLTLERLREYDYSPYGIYGERGVETSPGRWQLRGLEGRVPLLYGLEARR